MAKATSNMGPEIASVRDRLRDTWQVPLITYGVAYPAKSVNVLKPSTAEAAGLMSGVPATVAAATASYKLQRVNPYLDSITVGVNATVSYLVNVSRQCGYKHPFVLAGYSQGAIVMHRVMAKLATTAEGVRILNRVTGVVLLADGDRVANSKTALLGGAPATGKGITPVLRTNPGGDITLATQAKTINVCAKGDLVCDTGLSTIATKFAAASKVHTSYVKANVAGSPLGVATDWVGRRTTGLSTPPPPLGMWKQISGSGDRSRLLLGQQLVRQVG